MVSSKEEPKVQWEIMEEEGKESSREIDHLMLKMQPRSK